MKLSELMVDNVKVNLEAMCEMVQFNPYTDQQGNVCSIEIKYVPKDYKPEEKPTPRKGW